MKHLHLLNAEVKLFGSCEMMNFSNTTAEQCTLPLLHSAGSMNGLVQILLQTLFTAYSNISNEVNWPRDYGDDIYDRVNYLEEFDFVAIGAGSAGSVLASRLSENPDWRVLVLEAGGDPPIESEIPALLFATQHTNFTYNYYGESNPRYCQALQNGTCYWPRGKMIGGSGAINAMLYIRGNRRDYDNWLELGIQGWGFDDVWPYFQKSTQQLTNNSTTINGNVIINDYSSHSLHAEYVFQMLWRAAEERGLFKVQDFVEGSYIGYAKVKSTTMNGLRASTGKTYLGRTSKQRSNLKVIKNAQVVKLKIDETGERIIDVEFILRGKKKMKVKAKKEFILSAGTIDSAKLLMLSGIGSRQHLENLKIPVIHDLPIGENLQDHVRSILFYELNNENIPPITQKDILDNTYKYLLYKTGFLSNTGTVALTAFINVDSDVDNAIYPNIEIHHLLFQQYDHMNLKILLDAESIDEQYKTYLNSILNKSAIMIMFVSLAHPKSKGRLTLKSSNYMDDPKVEPNYFDDTEDLETLVKGVTYAVNLNNTVAFQQNNARLLHIPIEECDRLDYNSSKYWECYIKYFSTTLYHHVGTVKMAADSDPTGCVNSKLKLNGMTNIRIVDASIMPNIPSCNTNAPTIMVAERAADFIKEQWSS